MSTTPKTTTTPETTIAITTGATTVTTTTTTPTSTTTPTTTTTVAATTTTTTTTTNQEGITRLDRWIYSGGDIQLQNQLATASEKKLCNIYGEATVMAGRAEWDIKIESEGFGGIIVGLWRHNLQNKNELKELPLEEDPFVNFENGYGFTNKTGEFLHQKNRNNYSNEIWKQGSILTVHLDLNNRTLMYSIDGKSLGVAKDCLPRGAYRLAAKLQFKDQQINITRFWTSSQDDNIPQSPSVGIENKIMEKIENATTPITEVKNDNEQQSQSQSQSQPQQSQEQGHNNETKEVASSSSSAVTTNTEADNKDLNQTKLNDANDDGKENISDDEIDSISGLSDLTTDSKTPETSKNATTPKKLRHNRACSLTEMRDQIRQQKRDSISSKDGKIISQEEIEIGSSSPIIRSRTLSASANGSVPPIDVPERVEVEEKDDDSTDTFVIAGNYLSCEVDTVTCTKEAKGVRNSAFGAQVVTHGRMDWLLQIEKGHSIRIGVSGVTHTGEDFTNSQYGYGYGEDGNIYCHHSLIEWGDGYKAGDKVGVHLDMEKRTLRFSVNGDDRGIAFENLQVNEDAGIDGYRLAVSLQYRPHQVKLLESTLYNTKQYSPRPNNFGNRDRAPSWFTHTKTPSDEFKNVAAETLNASTQKKVEQEEEKISTKEPAPANTKTSVTDTNTTKTTTTTVKKKPTTKSKTPKKENTTKNGPTVTKKTSNDLNDKKTQPNGKAPLKPKSTSSQLANAKNPPIRQMSTVSTRLNKPAVSVAVKTSTLGPSRMASDGALLGKKASPVENIKWKAPRIIEDQFAFSGLQLHVDAHSCIAKNSIQDGNSAFGSLEVTKDMKVEWTLKIAQGAQVAVGVMQTDDSLKKNNARYRKLLNNIFCTDRLGYGYFGKDGGVMKGGKYRKYGAPYKAGDSVTVSLDMVTNQLEFKKGSKSQGIAFPNIPTGCYRLAVMLPKKMHKVVIEKVEIWEVDK